LFASHPSNAKNGCNLVFLKLSSSINKLAGLMNSEEIEDLKDYTNEGLLVENMFIFGRQVAA
jgi:hypothetical protein